MADQNESQLFDKNALLEEFKDEADILQVAIEIFTQKYETILQEISQAIVANDAPKVHFKAHELKGAVSNFRCSGIVESLQKLEMKGKENELDEAKELYTEIESNISALATQLKKIA